MVSRTNLSALELSWLPDSQWCVASQICLNLNLNVLVLRRLGTTTETYSIQEGGLLRARDSPQSGK